MNVEVLNEKITNHQKLIDEHEERINNLEKTYTIMAKMDVRMNNVEKTLEKINNKMDKQTEEKGTKWDKLIDYLFYFILATILGYIAIKIGFK